MGKNEHKTVLNCSLYIYVHKFQVDSLLHLAALHHLPPEITILYLHFYFWPPAPMCRCPTQLIPTLHISLQKQKQSEQTASCSVADLHSCLFLYLPSLFPFSALCVNCIKPWSSSPSFSEVSPVSAIALTPFKVWLMLDFLSSSHHPFSLSLWSGHPGFGHPGFLDMLHICPAHSHVSIFALQLLLSGSLLPYASLPQCIHISAHMSSPQRISPGPPCLQ